MQELYELGINYFNKKNFVEALRCFSQIGSPSFVRINKERIIFIKC